MFDKETADRKMLIAADKKLLMKTDRKVPMADTEGSEENFDASKGLGHQIGLMFRSWPMSQNPET